MTELLDRLLNFAEDEAMDREAQPVAAIAVDRELETLAELLAIEPAGLALGHQRERVLGLLAVVMVPGGAQLLDRLLPHGPAFGRIDGGRGQHALTLAGAERPRAPRLALVGSAQPSDHLSLVGAQREIDQALEEVVLVADLGHDLDLPRAPGVELRGGRAGVGHQADQGLLEPLAVLGRGKVLQILNQWVLRGRGVAALGRRDDGVLGHVGERLIHDVVHGSAAERGFERGGVQHHRRLDRGRAGVLALVAVEERLRRHTRRPEDAQQALDLGAARAALAHQGQVEDLARQVAQVDGARQAAQLRDAQARIIVFRSRHQADRELGALDQHRKQVGVLPIEIDQHDPARGARLDGGWCGHGHGGVPTVRKRMEHTTHQRFARRAIPGHLRPPSRHPAGELQGHRDANCRMNGTQAPTPRSEAVLP